MAKTSSKSSSTSNKQYQVFLGQSIRNRREKMMKSQEELGKIAKLHRTYIGMIERGEKNITLSNLKKIANALGVKVRDLIDF